MSDATVPTHQLVVFSLGREEYAAPITRVQEIIDWTEPRTVSSDVPWMRGVISLRGKIVPVCDLGARIGIGATGGGKIVIVEAGGDQAGVIVDEVTEVLTVAETQLEDIAVADEELVQGIAKVDDRLIVLLNLDGVFAAAPAQPAPAATPAVPTLPAAAPTAATV
jgi:purine-binding chemotaxis protein CheW